MQDLYNENYQILTIKIKKKKKHQIHEELYHVHGSQGNIVKILSIKVSTDSV